VAERFWPLGGMLSALSLVLQALTFGNCQSIYLDTCAIILRRGKPRVLMRLAEIAEVPQFFVFQRQGIMPQFSAHAES
jgi:hypothetical protein